MVFESFPVGQKPDDPVMGRVLETRNERDRFVPRPVDQNLTAVRMACAVEFQQVVKDDHPQTKGQQKEKRDQHIQHEPQGDSRLGRKRRLRKQLHIDEHQHVFQQDRGAEFPHFTKGRVADDAPERTEQNERDDAQHARTSQKPHAVPDRENRMREKPPDQKVGDKRRKNRYNGIDGQNQPRRKVT